MCAVNVMLFEHDIMQSYSCTVSHLQVHNYTFAHAQSHTSTRIFKSANVLHVRKIYNVEHMVSVNMAERRDSDTANKRRGTGSCEYTTYRDWQNRRTLRLPLKTLRQRYLERLLHLQMRVDLT